MKIKAKKSFVYAGKRCKVGEIISAGQRDAKVLVFSGAAEYHIEMLTPVPVPVVTVTKPMAPAAYATPEDAQREKRPYVRRNTVVTK